MYAYWRGSKVTYATSDGRHTHIVTLQHCNILEILLRCKLILNAFEKMTYNSAKIVSLVPDRRHLPYIYTLNGADRYSEIKKKEKYSMLWSILPGFRLALANPLSDSVSIRL